MPPRDRSPIRDPRYGIGQASLLDRLIDREPNVTSEHVAAHAQSVRDLKIALRRDIEFLLNTRRPPAQLPAGATELPNSVFYYGLPDITGLSVKQQRDQQRLMQIIEHAVILFEPRLSNVSVTLQPSSKGDRSIRFQIEALLMIEPAPERIAFDTTLEVMSGEYQVEGEGRA